MGNTSGAKIKHMFYNPCRHNSKSGRKSQKVTQRYVELMMRIEKEGNTKWIQKTMEKCQARIKSYGITQLFLDQKLANKKANKLSMSK